MTHLQDFDDLPPATPTRAYSAPEFPTHCTNDLEDDRGYMGVCGHKAVVVLDGMSALCEDCVERVPLMSGEVVAFLDDSPAVHDAVARQYAESLGARLRDVGGQLDKAFDHARSDAQRTALRKARQSVNDALTALHKVG